VRQNKVLDPAPYLFPLPVSPHKKRKRQEVLSDEKSVDTTRANKSRKKDSQIERKKLNKEEISPASKFKVKEEGSSPVLKTIPLDNDQTRLRSPTPPSEHTHARSTSGGVKYSEHEREYALRYVEVLLGRDHQMAIGTMAGNLFRKVSTYCNRCPKIPTKLLQIPSHSHGSWRSFLQRTIRDDVELIRKRKSIAYRKARRADQGDRKPIKVEQSQDQGFDKGSSTSDPSPTPVFDRESVQKEDLETISRFFATRPEEDEEDDADVWAHLTSQVSCKSLRAAKWFLTLTQVTCQTASSWEKFYTEHHEEVNTRFNELTSAMP
jgi:hypothetical protein